MLRILAAIAVILSVCGELAAALEPNEILLIANTDQAASMKLARYYCEKRGVPSGNIIPVSLGTQLRDSIGRGDYEKRLAGPIRRTFATRDDLGHIECLVTTYGVPFKVGRRDPLSGFDAQLKQLRQSLQEQNDAVAQLEKDGQANTPAWQERRARAMQIQMDIDRIEGKETDASVDSELAMVLSGP
jgi:uncharacterized protein (TIGR03790 family)